MGAPNASERPWRWPSRVLVIAAAVSFITGCGDRSAPDIATLKEHRGVVSSITRTKGRGVGPYLRIRIGGDPRTYATRDDWSSPYASRTAVLQSKVHVGDTIVFLARQREIWQLQRGGDTLRSFADQVQAHHEYLVYDAKYIRVLLIVCVPIIGTMIGYEAYSNRRREKLSGVRPLDLSRQAVLSEMVAVADDTRASEILAAAITAGHAALKRRQFTLHARSEAELPACKASTSCLEAAEIIATLGGKPPDLFSTDPAVELAARRWHRRARGHKLEVSPELLASAAVVIEELRHNAELTERLWRSPVLREGWRRMLDDLANRLSGAHASMERELSFARYA